MSAASTAWPVLSYRAVQFLDEFGPSTQWPNPDLEVYDPVKNPDGVIASLAVAENSLSSPELIEYINRHFELSIPHLKYRSSLVNSDQPNLATTIPRFLNKTLKPLSPITVEQALVGPGIGGLLSHLLWYLCAPGDGVLLTCPYYADYSKNLAWPSEANLVPVIAPAEVDSLGTDIVPYMRETLQKAENKIKVIILNNPHNPLGKVYSEEMIVAYLKLAEEFNVHLVSDEVFANEVFKSKYSPNPTPFKSVLAFPLSDLGINPSRVHVLAGPTKDLGASGVKLGAIVSQHNRDVMLSLGCGLPVTPISSASDAIFTKIIEDEVFLEGFLEENRKRLGAALELLGKWCEGHGFPFIKTEAGVFSLVDFASLADKIEGEKLTLHEKMDEVIRRIGNEGVTLRSSRAAQDPIASRLRVIFTSPPEIMKVAFERIERAFGLDHVSLE